LQGGGNMPAYGKALSPAETRALVAFLMTLRGNSNQAPAVDASHVLTQAGAMHLPLPPTRKTP
jgi:ubiquinol-cytochrome c reductase cytochrome b subunit